jgi:hypothetical protein
LASCAGSDRAQIAGAYVSGGQVHGYVMSEGTFTTIDFPSAIPVNTFCFGISNAGDVVGVENIVVFPAPRNFWIVLLVSDYVDA